MMVDAVVSFVVQRLGDLLIEQVVFLQGVKDEVESLRNKLEYILFFLKDAEDKYIFCFLKDAEDKQDGDRKIPKWISDIRDVSYEAEDIIENFILEVEEGRTPKKMGFKAWFEKYLCICSKQASLIKQANLYGIGTKINSLKDKLEKIQHNQEIFKIGNVGNATEGLSRTNERLNQLRRENPYEDNDLVVGFENDANLLMSELVKKVPQRCVVSIVGMGGLGKTTLARKLYNTNRLRDNFDSCAWVSVSKDYNIKDLLQRIIKSFEKPTAIHDFEMLEKMKEEDMETYLHDFLKGHRYLVVLDDIWDAKAWKILRKAFPDNKNGSRVIFTTRDKVVTQRCNETTFVYELPFLQEEESWELFCKKVLPYHNEIDDKNSRIPSDLETVARDMVRKCGGLPLAIIVLGGMLSRKDLEEWPKVKENIWRHVREDNFDVQRILGLSFIDLPGHLKSCFLYLGLFPEDTEINAERLYRLWVAEGLIKLEEESEESEDVAAKYLKELIDRSLVQIAERKWRRIISCRIHDLLRDFAIQMSEYLDFLHIYNGALTPKSRRLASHCGFKTFVSSDHSNSRLRSVLVSNLEEEDAEIEQLEVLCMKLRLLRVLSLGGLQFNLSRETGKRRLPDAIGKLIHLRYLGLYHSRIKELSPCIGKLQALQTLELDDDIGNPISLPDEICKAKQLRHLLGSFKWPFRVDNLTNLRTLNRVVVEDQREFDPMDLIRLRELRVSIVGKGNRFTLDSIGKLSSLRSFELDFVKKSSWFPPLRPLSQCQHLLQLGLYVNDDDWKLPTELLGFLPNLKYLLLNAGGMKEDPMPILEKLPKLTILELIFYNGGNKLACTARGFPQLQFLNIYFAGFAVELQVEEGGMPLLKGLTVPKEISIPERLRSIPAVPWHDIYEWPY